MLRVLDLIKREIRYAFLDVSANEYELKKFFKNLIVVYLSLNTESNIHRNYYFQSSWQDKSQRIRLFYVHTNMFRFFFLRSIFPIYSDSEGFSSC